MPKYYPGDAVEVIGQDVTVPNLITAGNVDGVDVSAHATNTTTAHGAVSAATASKFVVRDAEGQAKFAAPAASGDALIKGTRVTTAELPAMTDEKIWKGTGANVEEIDVPDATKEFFVPVTDLNTTATNVAQGDYAALRVDSPTEYFHATFRCPHDFTALTHCKILVIPTTTGTIDYTVTTDFAALDEAYNTNSDTDTVDGLSMTSLNIEDIDISAALTNLAADDYIGVKFVLDAFTTTTRIAVIGILFKYS